ncbi:MAG: peptidylprolyl isomerase [Polyangia bacterium]
MTRAASVLAAVLLLACGDGREAGEGEASGVDATKVGPGADELVAEVDGVPVFAEELRWLLEESDGGIGVEEALDALVRNALLAREARRRGWGDHPEVIRRRDVALARALLLRLVGSLGPRDLPEKVLRQEYERQRRRFVHGPQRGVIHAVAKAKDDPAAAEELAREVRSVVEGAADAESFRRELEPLLEDRGSALKVEKLPPFERDDDRFVPAFTEAAFEAGPPGSLSEPFETRFGWHVLLVLEKRPAEKVEFEEARAVLAREMLPAFRSRRAEELIARLWSEADPLIREEVLRVDGGQP